MVEEWPEPFVTELRVADPGADLDPEEAELDHYSCQLGHGQVDVLQRHRAEGPEPGRRLTDHARQELVLRTSQRRCVLDGGVMAQGAGQG
jgi:hypothetical protein